MHTGVSPFKGSAPNNPPNSWQTFESSTMTIAIDTKFNFKARAIKDEKGEEIGKSKKQPSLVVGLPQLTKEEVIAILSSEDPAYAKAADLIMEGVYAPIKDQAKQQLDEAIDSFNNDETKTISVELLDFDKLDFLYIANLPPAQRGARAIPEEDYEVFFADYLTTMVAATGKPEVKIKNHIDHFKKPARIKTAKDILNVLVQQLDLYIMNSGNIEETGEVAQRVRSKFDRWLKEDDKFDLEAL
jgi:hypothetical protein